MLPVWLFVVHIVSVFNGLCISVLVEEYPTISDVADSVYVRLVAITALANEGVHEVHLNVTVTFDYAIRVFDEHF